MIMIEGAKRVGGGFGFRRTLELAANFTANGHAQRIGSGQSGIVPAIVDRSQDCKKCLALIQLYTALCECGRGEKHRQGRAAIDQLLARLGNKNQESPPWVDWRAEFLFMKV